MLNTESISGQRENNNDQNKDQLVSGLADLVVAKVQPQEIKEKWRLVVEGLKDLGIELKDISELTEEMRVQF